MRRPTALLVLLMLVVPAAAQPSAVSGVVLDGHGAPVAGVDVSLHPAGARAVLDAAPSGDDGAYALTADTTGLFDLRFAARGTASETVTLFLEAPAETLRVDVHLAAGASDDSAGFRFGNAASSAARVARFADRMGVRQQAFMEGMRALQDEPGTRAGLRSRMERWQRGHFSQTDSLAAAALAEATSSAERQALLVLYLDRSVRADSSFAREALDVLAPDAPLWAAGRYAMTTALRAAAREDAALEYARAALEREPPAHLQPGLLAFLVAAADRRGDAAAAQDYFVRLERDFPNSPELDYVRREYDPGRHVRAGRQVPSFEVEAMGEDGAVYSDASLRGKTYLVDFWAVWCAPCISEMPRLHAAYERYRDRGFTILSVSLDDAPSDVAAFRAQRYPMPWLHAYIGPNGGHPVARAFEVDAIPKPVLVGPDGRILATMERLRGPNLDETLSHIFGD